MKGERRKRGETTTNERERASDAADPLSALHSLPVHAWLSYISTLHSNTKCPLRPLQRKLVPMKPRQAPLLPTSGAPRDTRSRPSRLAAPDPDRDPELDIAFERELALDSEDEEQDRENCRYTDHRSALTQ